ncbi:olfactory receptor 5V1-like [Hyperolius riggenbachi]|uniref:olfactory receptor 5V1-like n=1 Tax=Hyperolius riggenbachi TaxID=752182 RepID=UPI0035A32A9F
MPNTSTELLSTDFILVGFSDVQHAIFLAPIFLTTYMLSLFGNVLLLYLTMISPHLHSPMYFFLSNLSLVDLCLTTVVVPRLLLNLLLGKKSISPPECFAQAYFFIAFAGLECFILSIMAMDRFVAVCKSLHYVIIMNKRMCLKLALASWIINFVNSVLHTLLIATLTFCGPKVIQHFFCDLFPLFKLACSKTSINQLVIFTEGFVVVAFPFLVTFISYIHIIWTILNIHSTSGRKTAFSTCSAHLSVVLIFYGTVICVYFRPSSTYSLAYDRLGGVLYTVITPMLNPFIFSLRNKDVKAAFKKFVYTKLFIRDNQ